MTLHDVGSRKSLKRSRSNGVIDSEASVQENLYPSQGSDHCSIDELSTALSEAQHALDKVTTIAERSLSRIEARYNSGHASEPIRVQNACQPVSTSMQRMNSIISRLQFASRGCPINKVPAEILATIFNFLNWKHYKSCKLVCKHWQAVMLATTTLWKKPPSLEDEFLIMDRRYKAYCEMSGGNRFETISLAFTNARNPKPGYKTKDMMRLLEKNSTLVTRFPHSTLRLLDLFVDDGQSDAINATFWKCILNCTQLKDLSWAVRSTRDDNIFDYSISGTPLANCRLDRLLFDVDTNFIWDQAFCDLTSTVKNLTLNVTTPSSCLAQMLETAKDSIEELTFTGYGLDDDDDNLSNFSRNQDSLPELLLPNLFQLHFDHTRPAGYAWMPYKLCCPRLTSLALYDLGYIHWSLIDCCRSTLKSFTFDCDLEAPRFRSSLDIFNFPELEHLVISSSKSHLDLQQEPLLLGKVFWQVLEKMITNEAHFTFLSKLKTLTFDFDDFLDLHALIKWIRHQKQFNMSPIEELTIAWPRHFETDYDTCAFLEANVAKFNCTNWDGQHVDESESDSE